MVAWLIGTVAVVAGQRLGELWLAAANRRWLLAHGAREYGAEHYPLFIWLHAGWLAALLAESLWRGPTLAGSWPLWLGLFLAAQLLRYWSIVSLGRCWTTRILVIPGNIRRRRGPYRYLRHPNYLAVALELAALPLVFGAWATAAAASLLNAWLLLAVRIPAENQALTRCTKG
jgi:methyltransferase